MIEFCTGIDCLTRLFGLVIGRATDQTVRRRSKPQTQTQIREHTNRQNKTPMFLITNSEIISLLLPPLRKPQYFLARLCILMPPPCSTECHCKCVSCKWPSHILNYFLPIHSQSFFSSIQFCLFLH